MWFESDRATFFLFNRFPTRFPFLCQDRSWAVLSGHFPRGISEYFRTRISGHLRTSISGHVQSGHQGHCRTGIPEHMSSRGTAEKCGIASTLSRAGMRGSTSKAGCRNGGSRIHRSHWSTIALGNSRSTDAERKNAKDARRTTRGVRLRMLLQFSEALRR